MNIAKDTARPRNYCLSDEQGHNNIISGLENAIEAMQAGDTF